METPALHKGHGAWTDESIGYVLDRDNHTEHAIRNINLEEVVKDGTR